jgi:protein-S-isoprenylcysteine O-methyltransferase Ste14
MYSVSLATWVWIPLSLGSLLALSALPLIALLIIGRLLHEEKILRRDLPGYGEYCRRTRYRLIPGVW